MIGSEYRKCPIIGDKICLSEHEQWHNIPRISMKQIRAASLLLLVLNLTAPLFAADPAAASSVREQLRWSEGTKVLVVGGGASHDFQKWFNKADLPIIQKA